MSTGDLKAWDPSVNIKKDDTLTLDDLQISFHRTVRVPDNTKTNDLPPSLGRFPLFEVGKYADTLPSSMVEKGGVFFPMYQREAMWINFSSIRRYAIKIYSGNTNAISGEPAVETDATIQRRRSLLQKGKSIQDFVVVPKQRWLDGTAVAPGKVRQFVAMPLGSGYSVDAQLTGSENTGGLRFEITRLDYPSGAGPTFTIVLTDNNDRVYFGVNKTTRVGAVLDAFHKRKYEDRTDRTGVPGVPSLPSIRVLYKGRRLEMEETMSNAGIKDGDVLELQRLYVGGGGGGKLPPEIILATGGMIKQAIAPLPERDYQRTVTLEVNVQIINASHFQAITGRAPPKTPVSAETYISNGYPFFSIWEEPTRISGPSFGVKSIGQIDGKMDAPLRNVRVKNLDTGTIQTDWMCTECSAINSGGLKYCDDCGNACHRDDGVAEDRTGQKTAAAKKVGLLNPNGSAAPLKFSWELAEELGEDD